MPMKLFDSFGNTFVRSTEQEKSCVYFTVNQRVDTNLLAQINVMPAVIRIEEKKKERTKAKKNKTESCYRTTINNEHA